MIRIVDATFDGKVFHPERPIGLKPNTRVKITLETEPLVKNTKLSFLQTAKALNLDGPCDWAGNIDEYLYGK